MGGASFPQVQPLSPEVVMAGFIPAIHVLLRLASTSTENVDARDAGERNDAVLRTAMPPGMTSGPGSFSRSRHPPAKRPFVDAAWRQRGDLVIASNAAEYRHRGPLTHPDATRRNRSCRPAQSRSFHRTSGRRDWPALAPSSGRPESTRAARHRPAPREPSLGHISVVGNRDASRRSQESREARRHASGWAP